MKIIVGLGNYPHKYKYTRHNVGFLFVDWLAKHLQATPWQENKKLYARHATAIWNAEELHLLKPQTLMNASGQTIIASLKHWNASLQAVVVVADDLHLPWGTIRWRNTGSAGGHQGLQNIIALAGSQDFPRLKIGLSTPPAPDPAEYSRWVLEPLPSVARQSLHKINEQAWGELLNHLQDAS